MMDLVPVWQVKMYIDGQRLSVEHALSTIGIRLSLRTIKFGYRS